MREVAYTNDPFRIARNPKVVAINSAIQIDLTGQVCADSLGTRMYSGVGRPARLRLRRLAFGGRQAGHRHAVADGEGNQQDRSRAGRPEPGVVTPRSRVHYVVTEYGAGPIFTENRCRSGPGC